MVNSKRKGKRGELELAAILKDLFGLDARRGVQYQGSPDSPDVVWIEGIHLEVKRTERLRLQEALRQAQADADDSDVPMVVHKASREPWVALVRLVDLPRLAEILWPIVQAKLEADPWEQRWELAGDPEEGQS